MNNILTIICCFGLVSNVSAQSINGKVIFALTEQPVKSAQILLLPGDYAATTDADGQFQIDVLTNGFYQLEIIYEGVVEYAQEIEILGANHNVGIIDISAFNQNDAVDNLDVISLSEDDLSDDGDQASNVSSLLSSSRDVFLNLAAFNLNAGRYAYRGMPQSGEFHLNNFKLNSLENGRFSFSVIGGLNDVLRNQENSFSLKPKSFAFGNIGLVSNIDIRASSQRKQIRASQAISNRSYRHRTMLTFSTGVLESGWAFSFSGSRRWADSGYVKGTFYDGFSYFGAISKVLNDQSSIHFNIMASPTKRGRSGPVVKELSDVTGNNFYNSYWGFQNGKVRNSRIYDSNQPILTLTYDLEMSDRFALSATALYQTGTFGSSGLDWYNAPDPRPDYWRNLPSNIDNPETTAEIANLLNIEESKRQIQWDQFYATNRNSNVTINDVDGIAGNNVTGGLSNYIVQEQHFDVDRIGANLNLTGQLSESISVASGINYTQESNHNYLLLKDLLGGEFFVDYDEFAQRDFPGDTDIIQNDLNRPNRLIYLNDRFGWDYDINIAKADFWVNTNIKLNRLEIDVGVTFSKTSFYRDGFMKNGKFPDSSFGKSETNSFSNYGLKLGSIYAINGRNYLYANGYYGTQAPNSRVAYVSPRTRDEVVSDLKSEKRYSIEGGYLVRFPSFKARVTGFLNKIEDRTGLSRFYFDNIVNPAFSSMVLQGIDQRHAGIEAAAEIKLTSELSLGVLAAVGQYLYDSRPNATLIRDVDGEQIEAFTVYQQDYFVPGVPQGSYTAEFNYNSPKFWFASLNVNYFTNSYLNFSPRRRSVIGVSPISQSENPELFNSIIAQEKLPSGSTIDFFGGKSWKINEFFIYLNAGVNNILNKKNLITGGFEQSVFDYQDKEIVPELARYFYAYGTNYFISISLRI